MAYEPAHSVSSFGREEYAHSPDTYRTFSPSSATNPESLSDHAKHSPEDQHATAAATAPVPTYPSEKGERIPEATPDRNKAGYESYPEVFYENYPEVNYAAMHSYQAPQLAHDRDNYPQMYNETGPVPYKQDQPYQEQRQDRRRKMCGLPVLWFWVVVAAVAVAVIVAAVVGGVVGSRNSGSGGSTRFMPTTALAAINYTEVNGVQHSRVYFQAENGDLYQTGWDSNSVQWTVTPVRQKKAKNEPKVKKGTPLTAYVYKDSITNILEYHLFFLDTRNRIWEAQSTEITGMWNFPGTNDYLNGNYTAASTSKLAVYAQQCDGFCTQTSSLIWQDAGGNLEFAGYVSNFGWWTTPVVADQQHRLVNGSGLALAPIWGRNHSGPLSLYANTGNLSVFHFNEVGQWEHGWTFNHTMPGTIDQDAQIAAFSMGSGYNGTADTMSNMEVLATQPGLSGGGVSTWDSQSLNPGQNWVNSNSVSAFSAVANSSSIAATPAGRVYVIEGETLMEYQWQQDSRTYTKIGVVNTQT